MIEPPPLEATPQVAVILNQRKLAVNEGMEDGIKIGDIFEVFSGREQPIYDPRTRELLGSVWERNTFVEVVDVMRRFCVCVTFQKFLVKKQECFDGYAMDLFAPTKYVDAVEELTAAGIARPNAVKVSVQVGDVVFLLSDEEKELRGLSAKGEIK